MQEINGNTKIFGIVGNPVRHTMSPKIHNYLATILGHNLIYLPFEVENELEAAIAGAYALGIEGLNVTVPYKNAVIETLAEIDAFAAEVGAVNTLVRTEGGYKGYNTDVLGLQKELETEGIVLSGRNVVLLGAGGAARAVAFLCAMEGAANIYIINRNHEKAIHLSRDVNAIYSGCTKACKFEEFMELPNDNFIAFQCTAVGLYPNVEDVIIKEEAFYEKLSYAVDLIYTPHTTKFMQLAAQAGAYAVGGTKMLLYQAVKAYELWSGEEISDETINNLSMFLIAEGLLK